MEDEVTYLFHSTASCYSHNPLCRKQMLCRLSAPASIHHPESPCLDCTTRITCRLIMKSFSHSITAFRQAHRIIWGTGLWRYFIIPVILSVLYFPLLVAGCLYFSNLATSWLLESIGWLGGLGNWARWTVNILVLILLGFFGIVTYRSVVMIFYSPFLDAISEKVEEILLGRKVTARGNIIQTILRVGAIALLTIGCSVVLLVLDVAVSGIPLIGGLLTLIILLPIQFFIAGIGNVDPFLDRNGYGAMESFRLMRRNFGAVAVLSVLSSLFLLIPLFGWFIGPTYSVVAGVALGIRIDEKKLGVQASA